jgi:hypothetical protein
MIGRRNDLLHTLIGALSTCAIRNDWLRCAALSALAGSPHENAND